MNILGCLDRPTLGHYYLDGIDTAALSPDELSAVRNKKIGFVFQSFNLISRTSALKNVEAPDDLREDPEKEKDGAGHGTVGVRGAGKTRRTHAQ